MSLLLRSIAVAVLAAGAWAQDVVTLKDGRVLVGTWNPVNLTMTLAGAERRVVPVELYQIAAVAQRPDMAAVVSPQADVVRLKDGRVLVGVFNPLNLTVTLADRQVVPVQVWQIAGIQPAPVRVEPPAPAPVPAAGAPAEFPTRVGIVGPVVTAVVLSSWILVPWWRHSHWHHCW